jgi:hypothetical protein
LYLGDALRLKGPSVLFDFDCVVAVQQGRPM